MICVTTRFHLRRFWHLLPMYLAYKRIKPDLRKTPGLIRFAFLVEHPCVCFTFSIWETQDALEKFANTSAHIRAVRQAKQLCQNIWSAYWHLDAVSKYANMWQDSVPWPSLVVHPSLPHRLVAVPKQEFAQ
jgi:hypothetical protein